MSTSLNEFLFDDMPSNAPRMGVTQSALSPKQTAVVEHLDKEPLLTLEQATRLIGKDIYANREKHVGALLSNMVKRGLILRLKPGLYSSVVKITAAELSECERYRYTLRRTWCKGGGTTMFIGLNPSTADATNDDPTIARCMAFARSWNHGRLVMCNLFAFRATDPNVMIQEADPVGPDNDAFLLKEAAAADVIVAAWGVAGGHRGRDKMVLDLLRPRALKCLQRTRNGMPGHPLYLPAKCTLHPYP